MAENWNVWFGIVTQWISWRRHRHRARRRADPRRDAVLRMPAMANTGASVVVVGGGVTGLSAAWWLARSGVDVTVLEKGIVGFEASGRNGGGCTHYPEPAVPLRSRGCSRRWTNCSAIPRNTGANASSSRWTSARPVSTRARHAHPGRLPLGGAGRKAGARAGAARRRQRHLGRASAFWRPCRSPARLAGLRLGGAGSWRADPPARRGARLRDRRRARRGGGDLRGAVRLRRAGDLPPVRRPARSWGCWDTTCRWRRLGRR